MKKNKTHKYDADLNFKDIWGKELFYGLVRRADSLGDIKFRRNIKHFQYKKHTAFMILGHIKIGHNFYNIEFWINNYKTILGCEGYTDCEIKKYGDFIMECKDEYEKQSI